MNDCGSCYPNCLNNVCETKLSTLPCDPNDKTEWFKDKLPNGTDPVLSNIYNGFWLCNLEPEQTQNNILCKRHFQGHGIQNPYYVDNRVKVESAFKCNK